MSERSKSIIIKIAAAIVFCICVALVVMGHKNIGLSGLLTQLLGLAGLLALLGLYNHQYK